MYYPFRKKEKRGSLKGGECPTRISQVLLIINIIKTSTLYTFAVFLGLFRRNGGGPKANWAGLELGLGRQLNALKRPRASVRTIKGQTSLNYMIVKCKVCTTQAVFFFFIFSFRFLFLWADPW